MTRAEELARLQAQQLRQPRVDPFAQSQIDRLDHAEQARRARQLQTLPQPVKGFTGGGIPKVDKALKDAGVDD